MTNDDKRNLYAALSAPFGEDAIERTDGRTTGRGYDTTGIKYQYVVNRLNEVLGLGCWRTEQTLKVRETTTSKGRAAFDATCDLTLQFGEWLDGKFLAWAEVFATGGHQSLNEADARKGAFTNGLKKAAGMTGCGKQAYEGTLDDDNVPVDETAPAQPASQQKPQPAQPSPKPPAPAAPPRSAPPQPQSQQPQTSRNSQRLSEKQLGLMWTLARKLGYTQAAFREEVTSRFGMQPEALDPRIASGLIGQLSARAANGGSHPQA